MNKNRRGQTAQITRNNHYVPQFYLKNWSTNGHSIFTYDTVVSSEKVEQWRRCGIKNSACWSNFYTKTDAGYDDDDFELIMNARFETPAKELIEKVKQEGALSQDEMLVLINFLIAQMVRTPAWYLKTSDILSQTFSSVVESVTKRIEVEHANGTLKESITEAGQADSEDVISKYGIPLRVSLLKDENCVKVETYMGRLSFLSSAFEIIDGAVGDFMRSLPWKILTSPNGYLFPTSDNPVVVVGLNGRNEADFHCGVGQDNVDIFMPIDPHHLLFTKIGQPIKTLSALELDDSKFALLERAIILNATRYIYAYEIIDGIVDIRPRQIDPNYYAELENVRTEWHANQSPLEQAYEIAPFHSI